MKVVVIHISCRKMLLQITLEKRIQGDAWPVTESGFCKLTVCTSMICANCVSLFFGFIVFLNHKVFLQNFFYFFPFDIDFCHVFMIFFLMAWLLIDKNIMFILFIYYLKMNFYLKTYKYRHLKIVYTLTVSYVI